MTENAVYKIFYRNQYIPGVCHVCKSPAAQSAGLKCPECHLVFYCGSDHLEDDAESHQDLCGAFTVIARRFNSARPFDKAFLLDDETFKQFRFGMVRLCSDILCRPLLLWETEVCLFPPLCCKCHKYVDNNSSCSICCQIFWCSLKHRPVDHDQHCSNLKLFKDIAARKIGTVKSPGVIENPKRMTDLETVYQNKIEFSLISEIASSPLTILDSMPIKTSLMIHVIGAEPQFEANNIVKWETFLFNFIPEVHSLKIHFIGPEVGVCFSKNVARNGRKLSYCFYKSLYHKFETSNDFEYPNMICLFNPGLYRKTGYQGEDTWRDTIVSMFRRPNTPVLITAYTLKEIILDVRRVHDIVGEENVKTVVPPSANPFSSIRPIMNFVSDNETPVAFKNDFRAVLIKI